MTYTGSEAALIRDENSFIQKVKSLLMILFIRLPRAIRAWHIWLSAAAYGIFYTLRSG